MISLSAPKHQSGSSFFFLPCFPNSGSRPYHVIWYNINDVSALFSHMHIISAVSPVTLAGFKKLHPVTENT